MGETFWNGEPCIAVRGTANVGTAYRDRSCRRPVVRVEYGQRVFYLDDEAGIGWSKVTIGKGISRYGHRDLDVEAFEPAKETD